MPGARESAAAAGPAWSWRTGTRSLRPPEQVLALSEALDRFAVVEPRKAELVTLRFFGGLPMPEAADALGVSLPTAERWWAFARSWLYTELLGPDGENSRGP